MNDKNAIFNKGISTPVGILVIFILALIAGGVMAWQLGWFLESSEVNVSSKDEIADWKAYNNIKHNLSFKHPNLDDSCCNVSGPLNGSPEKIVVLADETTGLPNTDKPFDGLGIYIDPNYANETFQQYIDGQKQVLLQNYRSFMGEESKNISESPISVGGKEGIFLKGYAWWADMIYVPFPDNQKFLVIVKSEESKGSFSKTFNQILSTFRFNATAWWEKSRNEQYGFEFSYPKDLNQKYIKTYKWPPEITVGPINPNFICEESKVLKTSLGYGSQKKAALNNSDYCVLTGLDGTAGLNYMTYRYTTNRENKQLIAEFILGFSSCGVFDEVKMEECEQEGKNLDPTALIDKVLSTFKFLE